MMSLDAADKSGDQADLSVTSAGFVPMHNSSPAPRKSLFAFASADRGDTQRCCLGQGLDRSAILSHF